MIQAQYAHMSSDPDSNPGRRRWSFTLLNALGGTASIILCNASVKHIRTTWALGRLCPTKGAFLFALHWYVYLLLWRSCVPCCSSVDSVITDGDHRPSYSLCIVHKVLLLASIPNDPYLSDEQERYYTQLIFNFAILFTVTIEQSIEHLYNM